MTSTLNQVTGGVLESPTRVRLIGPDGEVVLAKR
jgi:hypothetical protein